jgi:hypothetical protein
MAKGSSTRKMRQRQGQNRKKARLKRRIAATKKQRRGR